MSKTPSVNSVLDILIEANGEDDTLRKQNLLRAAQLVATCSLTDAVNECTATLKEVANRQIDSTQDLEATIKKATNHVVIELRKATVRPAA